MTREERRARNIELYGTNTPDALQVRATREADRNTQARTLREQALLSAGSRPGLAAPAQTQDDIDRARGYRTVVDAPMGIGGVQTIRRIPLAEPAAPAAPDTPGAPGAPATPDTPDTPTPEPRVGMIDGRPAGEVLRRTRERVDRMLGTETPASRAERESLDTSAAIKASRLSEEATSLGVPPEEQALLDRTQKVLEDARLSGEAVDASLGAVRQARDARGVISTTPVVGGSDPSEDPTTPRELTARELTAKELAALPLPAPPPTPPLDMRAAMRSDAMSTESALRRVARNILEPVLRAPSELSSAGLRAAQTLTPGETGRSLRSLDPAGRQRRAHREAVGRVLNTIGRRAPRIF
jgi:hypothetical protein